MTETNKGKYGRHLRTFLIASDIVLVNVLFLITLLICYSFPLTAELKAAWLLTNAAFLPVLIWDNRTMPNRRAFLTDRLVVNSIKTVVIHALFFLSLLQLTEISFERSAYAVFYGLMIVAIPLSSAINGVFIKKFRRRGRNFSRVLIVGTHITAIRLYDEMSSDAGYGYKIIGFVDEEKPTDFPHTYVGDIDNLSEIVREYNIDEIFFTLAGEKASHLSRVAKVADQNVISFYYVPQISKFVNANFELHNLGSMPMLTLRRNPLNSLANRLVKRAFDLLFSSLFLVFSPLIFVPIAIAIKLTSPGSVFFKQERTGYRGKSFKCYKFRTMRVNKDADKIQATKDDPRKTRVGEFLRHTNLDELPQFINVFLGDMSVVGPRPHMLKHTELYSTLVDQYMVRHFVKPGITGWAQVNGYRGLTDEVWKMEKRVECDVWYIEHWHLFLDLKIIARTIVNCIRGEKNAF
jgi:putative colanic acid biosynthesis UDP-glucose lipid carrier transferase